MAKDTRFLKIYSQSGIDGSEIWVDQETGIQYLFHYSGYAGGLTPLLDSDEHPLLYTPPKTRSNPEF